MCYLRYYLEALKIYQTDELSFPKTEQRNHRENTVYFCFLHEEAKIKLNSKDFAKGSI